jgi:hypothetical protein
MFKVLSLQTSTVFQLVLTTTFLKALIMPIHLWSLDLDTKLEKFVYVMLAACQRARYEGCEG